MNIEDRFLYTIIDILQLCKSVIYYIFYLLLYKWKLYLLSINFTHQEESNLHVEI